jgi:hypothetical protein
MSDEKSRREFVIAGAAAAIGLQAVGVSSLLAAGPPQPKLAPQAKLAPGAAMQAKMFRLGKNNLAILSNKLFQNANERRMFLADPKGFAEHLFGGRLVTSEANKLQNIRNMVADGFCCAGCGCGSLPGAEFELPAVMKH